MNRLSITCLLLSSATLFAQSSTQTTLRNPPPGANRVLLVTLGVGDSEQTKWDGAITVTNGDLVGLVGYEMREGDLIHPPRRWAVQTRRPYPFTRRSHDVNILEDLSPDIHLSPRFHVYLKEGASTRVKLATEQGDVDFSTSDIPAVGEADFLGGRVKVADSAYGVLVGRGGRRRVDQRLTDNDYASVAVTSDGSVWTAWTGFSGFASQSDRVFAEKLDSGLMAPAGGRPHAVSPEKGDVHRTAIAEDAEGKIWVVWSGQVRGNFDLYGRSFDGTSWSRIERLTSASQPDGQHKLISDSQGRLHLVWQGFRSNKAGVFYKYFDVNDGWSDEIRVSASNAGNCWEPSITVDSNDRVYTAWDQYGENGYDIRMRSVFDGSGPSSDSIVEIAATKRFEAYVTLAADADDRIWLAWHESGINWGKDWGYPFDIQANGTGLYNSRNIRMAVWEQGRLRQPAGSLEETLPPPGPGGNFYEYPQLAVDGQGRVWCFYRHRRPAQHNLYWRTPSHHALWEIYASYYDGDKWQGMNLLPYSTGRNDMRVNVARHSDGGLVAAWPTDRRSFRDWVNMLPDVFAARIPTPQGAPSASQLEALSLPPPVAARQPPNRPRREMLVDEPVHPNDAEDVARIRDYVYEVNGKRYRIYRGDMHRHTEISWDGYNDGSLEDTYRYALDAADLDFLAITEHNFGVGDEYDWWRAQKAVDIYRVGSFFVPLYGYERSVTYPNGHRNVIFPYRGAPILDLQHYERVSASVPATVYKQGAERFFAYLRKYNAIAMPHTSATDMGTNWRDYDPEVEPIVEIYQSDRNSYECIDCWRSAPADDVPKQFGGYRPDGMVSVAWEKGYRLGVQASSDHLAVHTAYSVLIAEENSRESLVDAIRARRTYGATDNIIVDFRLVDGETEHMMGSDVTVSGQPEFRIHVEGTDLLGEVEIVKDNVRVYRQEPNAKVTDFTYRDNTTPDSEEASFYYVRVRQKDRDRQVAWGSPIWVTSR